LGTLAIPVVDTLSEAVRETHAKLTTNISRLVGSRMTPASVARIEVLLDFVEHFAIDNPTINFHLHMSGYNLHGKVFWVPIFEDQVVLDSPANCVLSMVYCYVESADSMLSGSTTLLEKKIWRAADKSRSRNKSGSRGLPSAASKLTDSGTPPSTGASSTGGAPSRAPLPSTASHDPGGASGDKLGVNDGAAVSDRGTNDSATDTDDDILLWAAPTGGRNRQSAKTCPETATAPLPVIPSRATKNVVMEFLTGSSQPLTLIRDLVPTMAKRVCRGVSVARIRVSRPWWPKTDKGKLWQQTVEVENKLLRAADKAKGPTDGQTLVYLQRMLDTRSATALERVANVLLMVEREPEAQATIITFNLRLQRTQLRRAVSIAPLSDINVSGGTPTGPGQSSEPTGQGQLAAPAGQGHTVAPAPAAFSPGHAARPSLAAAAAASRTAQGSEYGVGYGRHNPSIPRGPQSTDTTFDQTRVREALAAA